MQQRMYGHKLCGSAPFVYAICRSLRSRHIAPTSLRFTDNHTRLRRWEEEYLEYQAYLEHPAHPKYPGLDHRNEEKSHEHMPHMWPTIFSSTSDIENRQ